MTYSQQITSYELSAYFECRTKAALLAQSIPSTEPDVVSDLSQQYKLAACPAVERATYRTLIDFNQLADKLPIGDIQYAIDCQSAIIDRAQIGPLLAERTGRSTRCALSEGFSPILFCPFNRIQPWHTTILTFAALAIEHVTGSVPAIGHICFGHPPKLKTLRLKWPNQHSAAVQEFANARGTGQPVELNPHCSICQYKARCRRIARDEDSLSLVSSIPPKERRKLQSKGITTITQLSYTYRPRCPTGLIPDTLDRADA